MQMEQSQPLSSDTHVGRLDSYNILTKGIRHRLAKTARTEYISVKTLRYGTVPSRHCMSVGSASTLRVMAAKCCSCMRWLSAKDDSATGM